MGRYSREIWHKPLIDVAEVKHRTNLVEARRGSEALDCFRFAIGYGEASVSNHMAETIDLVHEKRSLLEL